MPPAELQSGWKGLTGQQHRDANDAKGTAPQNKNDWDGGAGRDRTADKGFADLCLTTWRPRPGSTVA
jgi:hypothetical protein